MIRSLLRLIPRGVRRLGWGAAAGWCALNTVASGCRARPPIDADLVIVDVTVIDGTDSPPANHRSVAVKGDRIVAVGPALELKAAPRAVVVDGRGKYLVPGLWDMHVHLDGYDEAAFPLFLANGVTSIREMGGDLTRLLALRGRIKAGTLIGPDLLIAGPTLDAPFAVEAFRTNPMGSGRRAVSDSADGAAAVDDLFAAGVDQIKVHSMTPRSAYYGIVAEARKRGIPVVGHVPDSLVPEDVIRAGQRTIEHDFKIAFGATGRSRPIMDWMLRSMQRQLDRTGPRTDINALFSLRLAGDDSARASADEQVAGRFARWAAGAPVWFDPTLAADEAEILANDPSIQNRPEIKYIPLNVRSFHDGPQSSGTPTAAEIEASRRLFANVMTMFRPLVAAGAKFVTGSDVPVPPLVPGFSIHRELELLVTMGLDPKRALQAATRNAAEAAGKLAESGTIEVGKRASLVLLNADPLAEIGNSKGIEAVILRGRLVGRAALDQMLSASEGAAVDREHSPADRRVRHRSFEGLLANYTKLV